MNLRNGTLLATAKATVTILLGGAVATAQPLQDLARANLRGGNLSVMDLSGADLPRWNLSGMDLSGMDLSGANLRHADLSGRDLSGMNLSGADLRGANLVGANLSGADLSGVNLLGANLRGANLTWANTSGADLRGANTSGANLFGVNSAVGAQSSSSSGDSAALAWMFLGGIAIAGLIVLSVLEQTEPVKCEREGGWWDPRTETCVS